MSRPPLPWVPPGREPTTIEWEGAKQATGVYAHATLSIDTYHWLTYLTLVWGYERVLLLLRSFCVPEHVGEAYNGGSVINLPPAAAPTIVPDSPTRDAGWRAFLCSPTLGTVLSGAGLLGGNAGARALVAALIALRSAVCPGEGGSTPSVSPDSLSSMREGICNMLRAHPIAASVLGPVAGTLLAACNLAPSDQGTPSTPSINALPGGTNPLQLPAGTPSNANDIIRAMQSIATGATSQRVRSYRSVPQLAEALGRISQIGYSAEDAVDTALASGLCSNADELLYAVMAQSFIDANTLGELASRVVLRPQSSLTRLSSADANQAASDAAKSEALQNLKSLFTDEGVPQSSLLPSGGSGSEASDPFSQDGGW